MPLGNHTVESDLAITTKYGLVFAQRFRVKVSAKWCDITRTLLLSVVRHPGQLPPAPHPRSNLGVPFPSQADDLPVCIIRSRDL